MKTPVEVKVPLSMFGASITLPEPCTYCGRPVDKTSNYCWHEEQEYTLKKWGLGVKFGNPLLDDLVINGKVQKRKVTVNAPYCAEHLKNVKLFKFNLTISVIVILLVSLFAAFKLLAYWGQSQKLDGVDILLAIGGLLFVGFWLGAFLGYGINSLISLIIPKYRGIAVSGSGHWGLAFSKIEVNSREGPIEYYLPIRFHNIESAKRFLDANPAAKIVKGKNLVLSGRDER